MTLPRSGLKKYALLFVWIFIGILVVWFLYRLQTRPDQLDSFARCLAEKKSVFYGAYWCPHCQNQKALFGRSAQYLPYVECSTPDGRSQLERCQSQKVEGYPTWEFANGERVGGELSLDALAKKTGCSLPGDTP